MSEAIASEPLLHDSCDPEQLYSSPNISTSSVLTDSIVQGLHDDKTVVKQRALDWLSSKIEDNRFIGKLYVDSLLKAMISNAEWYSEDVFPSKIKYNIKWKDYEFKGTGKRLYYAKEDAAIDAITKLLDIKLKGFVVPSKTKFHSEIMCKIKLDEVLLKSERKTYEMSVKVGNNSIKVKQVMHIL